MIFMFSTLEPSKKVKIFNNLQSANFKKAIKMCVNGWWFSSTLSSSNLTSRATLESFSSSSPSRCTCSFNYSSEFSSLNTIDSELFSLQLIKTRRTSTPYPAVIKLLGTSRLLVSKAQSYQLAIRREKVNYLRVKTLISANTNLLQLIC